MFEHDADWRTYELDFGTHFFVEDRGHNSKVKLAVPHDGNPFTCCCTRCEKKCDLQLQLYSTSLEDSSLGFARGGQCDIIMIGPFPSRCAGGLLVFRCATNDLRYRLKEKNLGLFCQTFDSRPLRRPSGNRHALERDGRSREEWGGVRVGTREE